MRGRSLLASDSWDGWLFNGINEEYARQALSRNISSPSPRKFAALSVAIEIKLCANLWGAGDRVVRINEEREAIFLLVERYSGRTLPWLRNDLGDQLAAKLRQLLVPPRMEVRQLVVVDAQ